MAVPEFVGSEFNDGFIAEVGSSSWDATSNDDPTIIAPGDFALDPNNHLITVNGAGRQYDSSVFLDNLRLTHQKPCTPGVVSDA